MANKGVYLDYNATCPLAPEVLEATAEALKDGWANPSSRHVAGKLARKYIENAREQVGRMINCLAEDIVFTSGGTESNNMVLASVPRHWKNCIDRGDDDIIGKPHIIISNLEHYSITNTAERLDKEGLAELTVVEARKETGAVGVDDIISAIRSSTVLITVMLAQNETGVLQPVEEIVKAVREFEKATKRKRRISIHTDAAQAIGKVRVDVQSIGVDYLTIAGHKFYGPRTGAIYSRDLGKSLREEKGGELKHGVCLYPLLCGGGQERGLRSGTENTGMIAGLGKACELVTDNIEKYQSHMKHIRDYLQMKLKETFGENVCFNGCYGEGSQRLPNTCNLSLLEAGLTGGRVMVALQHSQVSAGAACHSSGERPSAVLLASGVESGAAINALRVSVGRETSKDDIDLFVSDLSTTRNTILKEIM